MSDGLVQNLRSYPHASRSLRDEAANRIEALEQDCTALENHIKALEGEINTLKDALRELAIKTHTKAVEDADRIEALEAYGKHERSLGAEPLMIECNDLKQRIEELEAERRELGRKYGVAWALGQTYEAALREIAQDCYHSGDDNFPCCKARRALEAGK